MANGYIHTEFYYTGRQIWTKDVWKRATLRTDVLSNQIYSLLHPESPQNWIMGDLLVKTYYRERELSLSRTLMELRSWNFTVIYV